MSDEVEYLWAIVREEDGYMLDGFAHQENAERALADWHQQKPARIEQMVSTDFWQAWKHNDRIFLEGVENDFNI